MITPRKYTNFDFFKIRFGYSFKTHVSVTKSFSRIVFHCAVADLLSCCLFSERFVIKRPVVPTKVTHESIKTLIFHAMS